MVSGESVRGIRGVGTWYQGNRGVVSGELVRGIRGIGAWYQGNGAFLR